MITLQQNTQAVATLTSVDHGLSIAKKYDPPMLIILGDSMIFDGVITVPEVNVVADSDDTQAIDTISNPKPVGRLRRWCRRAVTWAVQAVRTARGFAAWVTTAVGANAARAGDWGRRYRGSYVGRHRTTANLYGRTRSTAEFVSQFREAAARSPRDPREGDLSRLPNLPRDAAFVGWIERYVEIMREEQLALHPPGRHFICS